MCILCVFYGIIYSIENEEITNFLNHQVVTTSGRAKPVVSHSIEPIYFKPLFLIRNTELKTNPSKTPDNRRYYVKSKKCRMPYADPFSRELKKIYNPAKLKVCKKELDLFQLTYDWITKHYNLQLNEDVLHTLNPFGNSIECNYSGVAHK